MRKWLLIVATVLLLLLCSGAHAETYVLDSIFGTIDIPETYSIVMTPENLDVYATWLESKGTDVESLRADFNKRGVLMQCWSEEGDVCLEITAVQNDRTISVFNVNEQSEDVRASYRLGHYPRNEYMELGYDFQSASWSKMEAGRFLVLKYTLRDSGEVLHRGFMRRTIYNGYEITLDMQIHGRSVTDKDSNALNKVWKTFRFVETHPLPPVASAKINITAIPPEETNERRFHIKGTAAEGVHFTAVVMGLSYDGSLLYEDTADKTGKFDLTIDLPKEGVFLVTFFAEYEGEDVMELSYPVMYERMLLTVNLDTEIPSEVKSDQLSITGDSVAGSEIQILLNGEPLPSKRVNAEGRFKVDIDTSEEGQYELVLAFSRKGLADRRLVYTFSRKWSDQDVLQYLQKQAIKPSYTNLIKNIDGYDGRIMGYKAYLVDASQSGDQWLIQMALNKDKNIYKNIILVISNEEPSFAKDERIMMYGTCAGMSVSVSGDENEESQEASYPCFELLLFTSLE